MLQNLMKMFNSKFDENLILYLAIEFAELSNNTVSHHLALATIW